MDKHTICVKKSNYMEQSPSSEANSSLTSQEIHRILWNPTVHYCIQKRLQPVPILSQINPIHASPSHFLKTNFNIIFPYTPRSSKMVSFLQVPPTKFYTNLSCLPCVPHAPPISFSIWSLKYLVRSKDHKAPRYVVFPTPLLPRPC